MTACLIDLIVNAILEEDHGDKSRQWNTGQAFDSLLWVRFHRDEKVKSEAKFGKDFSVKEWKAGVNFLLKIGENIDRK